MADTFNLKQGATRVLTLFSATNRTKTAYLNSMAAGMDYAARMVVGFLLIPILVAGLGDFLYGIWTVVRRFTGYVTASGARPTRALKCVIANKQESSDLEEKRRYVGSSILVCLLFFPIQGAMAGLVAWFAPIWLKVPADLVWTVRIATFLLVLGPLVRNLIGIPKSVLEGENLGYKRMGLSALMVCLGGVFTWGALYAETGLIGVSVASLGTILLTGLLYWIVVRAYVPWFGIRMPKWEMTREFIGLSWWFFAWKIIIKILMDCDVVILGILASAPMVTFYSLTKYGPEMLVNFVAIGVFGVTPGLGGIIGSGDLQKAARVRGEIMLLTWFVTTVVGAAIIIWNDSFLRLWVGPEYATSSHLTLLILVMVAQLVFIRNDANVIDLTLDLQKKVTLGVIAAATTIILSSYLVGWTNMGVTGLCVGFIVGRLVLSVGYPLIVGRKLDVPLTSQSLAVLRPGLFMILLFLALHLAQDQIITVHSWMALILCVGATGIVVSSLAFFIGMSHSQRKSVSKRLQSVTNHL